MTQRVPCKDCGAEILPATAEATGGVCMACKQGIRQNIEASKKFYKEQRKYNPVRELWATLVNRVHQTEGGFESLSADEQTYFAVSVLEGEVSNGGMHLFFWNSSGEYYQSAVNGLIDLKAFNSHRLLKAAADLLFDEEVPKDRELRWKSLKEYPDDSDAPSPEWVGKLSRIDTEFWEDPDGLSDRLEAFVRDRNLIQPFEKDNVGESGGSPVN